MMQMMMQMQQQHYQQMMQQQLMQQQMMMSMMFGRGMPTMPVIPTPPTVTSTRNPSTGAPSDADFDYDQLRLNNSFENL